MADEYAKAVAGGAKPEDAAPDECRWEASLSHMTRVATEARSRTTAQWISSHVGPEQRYSPPPGKGPRENSYDARERQPAATSSSSQDTWRLGPPEDKIGKTDDDWCWWKHPGAPLVKRLWKEKVTEAVLKFLRDTRVRCISTKRKPPEEECDGEVSNNDEGEEEGRPGPP